MLVICKLVILTVVLIASTTEAKNVSFGSCSGSFIEPVGRVLELDITPCDTDPCVFHRGDIVTAKITFIPEEVVQQGILELLAIFSRGERLPWPLENPFACVGHNLTCPLKPKEPATAVIKTTISEIPGTFKVVGQVYMSEPVQRNYVFCFRIPVQVTY